MNEQYGVGHVLSTSCFPPSKTFIRKDIFCIKTRYELACTMVPSCPRVTVDPKFFLVELDESTSLTNKIFLFIFISFIFFFVILFIVVLAFSHNLHYSRESIDLAKKSLSANMNIPSQKVKDNQKKKFLAHCGRKKHWGMYYKHTIFTFHTYQIDYLWHVKKQETAAVHHSGLQQDATNLYVPTLN